MKRIIIACDGTGQSASRGDNSIPTNVSRFCRSVSSTSEPQQIIFYQSGVGTQDLGWGTGMVTQALGSGIEDNIADGYTFLMNNYQPGDELFIFGFSRGAFTARVLANLVTRLGIIWKKYSWAFKDAMKAYQDGKLDNYVIKKIKPNQNTDFKQEDFTPWAYEVEIEVVGCWDTVASLGVPYRPLTNAGGVTGEYKHFDGSLVKGIKNAFHALALDECRAPFTPTLWYLPKNLAKSINLKQCWFPGVHTNVGGGYPDRALANLTLAWMIDLCRPFLDFDNDYLIRIVGLDHEPGEWHRNRDDHKEGDNKGAFDTEYQGWGHGMCYDSYRQGQTWFWKYRTPGAYSGGVTNEEIHASARERWETSKEKGLKTGKADWKPEALKGFKPVQTKTETGVVQWHWVKEGSCGLWQQITNGGQKDPKIPEAPFPETPSPMTKAFPSFEWMLRYGVPDNLKVIGAAGSMVYRL